MSNKDFKYGLLLIITLSLLTMKGYSQEKWTKEMEIYAYKGGGKNPETKTVIIKNSGGLLIIRNGVQIDSMRFLLSQLTLDSLLNKINSTHFKDIRSGRTEVTAYDKPTTQVRFKWAGQKNDVSIGAKTAILQGNAADFNALYNYILSLAARKTRG